MTPAEVDAIISTMAGRGQETRFAACFADLAAGRPLQGDRATYIAATTFFKGSLCLAGAKLTRRQADELSPLMRTRVEFVPSKGDRKRAIEWMKIIAGA